MPDSCCAVRCTNMRGNCNEKVKFYRFPTMKTEQTTETRKKWITAMKRENWPKSEKQVDNARLCSEHFVTGDKSDDPLHIDYIPHYLLLSLWLVPREREKVLIDMKDLKNVQKTRAKKKKKKKDSPNKTETALFVDSHKKR